MTPLRVAIIALVYLVGTLGQGGKLVLCITDVGHVALEFALNACCEPASDDGPPGSRAQPKRTGDSPPGARCDCCMAIPIPTTQAPPHVAPGGSRVPGAETASVAFGVTVPCVGGSLVPVSAVDVPPPLPPPLASLRTVVLLS